MLLSAMITTIGSPVGSAGKAPSQVTFISFGAALAGWLFRRRAQN